MKGLREEAVEAIMRDTLQSINNRGNYYRKKMA